MSGYMAQRKKGLPNACAQSQSTCKYCQVPGVGILPRPQDKVAISTETRPTAVVKHLEEIMPVQHPLAVYEQLLINMTGAIAA